MKKYIKAKKLENLKSPLIVAATNFKQGKIEYFDKGPLIEILLASAGIPFLFEVAKVDEVPYIDGGVMDNLPLEPLKNKCNKLIGVHVNPIGESESPKSPMHVAERAFNLAIASEIERKRRSFDWFIEPEQLKRFGMFDLKKANEIYNIGYNCAKEIFTES